MCNISLDWNSRIWLWIGVFMFKYDVPKFNYDITCSSSGLGQLLSLIIMFENVRCVLSFWIEIQVGEV